MIQKKYSYTICTVADEEIFYKQCKALEKNIPNLKKMELLQDVDYSLVQIYNLGRSEILVYNDLDTDIVCIKSDIELERYFK